MKTNPLLDKEFMTALFSHKHREIFARLISLTLAEEPLQTLEGRVTGGSINVDGSSAVRRTCNIQMVAYTVDFTDFYWGLNTKFKVEIGLTNNINSYYPPIIWIPAGIYAITSFNANESTNNFTISISGKDKMCYLNGEVSGSLPHSVDFGKEEVTEYTYTVTKANNYRMNKYYIYDETQRKYILCNETAKPTDKTLYYRSSVTKYNQLPIIQIIREAVFTYGNERHENIIINDLEEYGQKLIDYKGQTALYIVRMDNETYPAVYKTNQQVILEDGTSASFEDFSYTDYPYLDNAVNGLYISDDYQPTKFKFSENGKTYTLVKYTTGEAVGYEPTALIYAGDLIANAGESLTSILDKIVKMLGDFEYFYDVEGRFIFQRKRTYVNVSWSSIIDTNREYNDEEYVEDYALAHPTVFDFKNGLLISSFQNSPNLLNLRNDYSLWGSRTSGDTQIPIHLRYAIDKIPTQYSTIEITQDDAEYFTETFPELWPVSDGSDGKPMKSAEDYVQESVTYVSDEVAETEVEGGKRVNWREVLYQMALDYRKWNHTDDFFYRVAKANAGAGLYINGKTGYEQYYTDILGFWRDLYLPKEKIDEAILSYNANDLIVNNLIYYEKVDGKYTNPRDLDNLKADNAIKYSDEPPENAGMVFYDLVERNNDGTYVVATDYGLDKNIYLRAQDWSKFDPTTGLPAAAYKKWGEYKLSGNNTLYALPQRSDDGYNFSNFDPNTGWNYNVTNTPHLLNFWIEFLDTTGQLAKYSVPAIGDRPRVVNDDKIKGIYFREVPNLVFMSASERQDNKILDNFLLRTGKDFCQYPDSMSNLFVISTRGKSAKDEVENQLYNYSYCTENVNINAIPIYNLEPNTKIYIEDERNHIVGDYIVNRLTIPLAYNGTMQISAVKAVDRIV